MLPAVPLYRGAFVPSIDRHIVKVVSLYQLKICLVASNADSPQLKVVPLFGEYLLRDYCVVTAVELYKLILALSAGECAQQHAEVSRFVAFTLNTVGVERNTSFFCQIVHKFV